VARILAETFPADAAGTLLLRKVRQALRHLTGMPPPRDDNWTIAPVPLVPERDFLREDWRTIWLHCTIRFDPSEPGASIRVRKDMRLGPFFLGSATTVLSLEKVLLHEYLHAALELQVIGEQHDLIDRVLEFHLGYPGPPNPAPGRV
jgi:hypothetical protein